MIVAIDHDGTWTREPMVFEAFVRMMLARGHICVMVTGRSDEGKWGAEVRRAIGDLMPIVFAANGWKIDALKQWMRGRSLPANEHIIWIDDNPWGIAPAVTIFGRDEQ